MASVAPIGMSPRVLIVGGGFGGLEVAKGLRRAPVQVTLVDRRNHFVFQPLLYQVATAGLSPGDIAAPIRSILHRQANCRVMLGEVVGIDLSARIARLSDGEDLAYDLLVLAAGSRTSFFGHDDWAVAAPGLKTIEDALEMRRRALLAFEAAERTPDPEQRQRLLTFVVVGGGPTGVELAGALAELARHTLRRDFRVIDPTRARVVLVEASPRVLNTFPESLSASARRQLARLGVEVITERPVRALTRESVTLDDQVIHAGTILWGAGVQAVPLAATLGVPLDRGGRIIVDPDGRIPGHPTAYAIGDIAAAPGKGGRPLPGVAPVAMQAGRAAAANIIRQIAGEPTRPFRYFDKGNVATIGRAAGVADFGWARVSGLLAWLCWLSIHIWYLVDFQNRFVVFVKWAWSYLTYQRGARLITGETAWSRAPLRAGDEPRAVPE